MLKAIVLVVGLALVIAGCGGGAEADEEFVFQAQATDVEGNEVTPEGEERWAEVWCDLNAGLTRDEAIEAMGTPTSEFDATQGQPQSQWDTGVYDAGWCR